MFGLLAFLEPCRFVGAARGVAGTVGVGAGAGQLACVDDQVLVADRSALEPALEDLARPGGVTGLGRQSSMALIRVSYGYDDRRIVKTIRGSNSRLL